MIETINLTFLNYELSTMAKVKAFKTITYSKW